jgi:methionyl aminopeptidase
MSWERNIVSRVRKKFQRCESGRINAMALSATRDAVRQASPQQNLNAIAEEVIRKHGGVPTFLGYPGPYPFPATLTISINEELVHGIPGKRKLKEGDIVSIDCGTTFEGFVGDSAITIGVGEISQEARKLLEVTENSLYEGILKMKAGNRIGDVSAAIQHYVESYGYQVPREYTGHGVGRQMHEGPQVPNYGYPGRGQLLRTGMTIALEPMVLQGTPRTKVLPDKWTVVSADDSLTAHFEHTIAVTNGDARILTLL